MNFLAYFNVFLGFLMDDYLNGFWIAGIGFCAIFLVINIAKGRRVPVV